MGGQGFEEAQSTFQGFGSRSLVGEVRRFGPCGPAYEVIAEASASEVEIVVIASGERLSYPLAELLSDPIAETMP